MERPIIDLQVWGTTIKENKSGFVLGAIAGYFLAVKGGRKLFAIPIALVLGMIGSKIQKGIGASFKNKVETKEKPIVIVKNETYNIKIQQNQ